MAEPGTRPLVIAHRAGNELGLLRAAEDAGTDLVEADVWWYRGALEVRHSKTMGPVPLLWDRWTLRGRWQPRLRLPELVAATAPGTHLFLDLKGRHPLLPGLVVEAMAELAPGRPYSVCSRNWDLLEEFRHYPAVAVYHSVGTTDELATVWPRLTWHDQHAISIHARLLDQGVVRALKEKASRVVTWPINTAAARDRVVGLGIDGIITDSLALARETIATRL